MSLDTMKAFALSTERHSAIHPAPTCDANGCSAVTARTARDHKAAPAPRKRPAGDRSPSVVAAQRGPAVAVHGVAKRYQLGRDNDVYALRRVDVEIERGEMVAIVGPSGSGKSTLMHIVGCLDTPDCGKVLVNGRRVDNLRGAALTRLRGREIGFIFQGFNLVPTMSAADNVALAAEYAGVSRKDALARAAELLELVGLAERADHLPSELSGGQQQRVAIARALVNRPALVLGDEPTGDLDTATSDEIVALLRRINAETGTTFVIVTHNPEVAAACDRTITMRDGAVEDHGYEAAVDRIAATRPRPAAPRLATASAAACC